MGYAFTYPVVHYLTAGMRPKRVAYIHYPTISLSMFRRVSSRESNYANSGGIASSAVLSTGKLMYEVLAPLHHFILTSYPVIIACLHQCISIVFVHNTLGERILDSRTHRLPTIDPCGPAPPPVSFLLSAFTLSIPIDGDRNKRRSPIKIIYPPCDIKLLTQLPLEGRRKIILSIAQFRFTVFLKSRNNGI